MARGGKREGAGRPVAEDPRVQVSMMVSQETQEILKRWQDKGLSTGRLVDFAVQAYAKENDI